MFNGQIFGHKFGFEGGGGPVYGPYTTAFSSVVSGRGGIVTTAEKTRLDTFETSLGSILGEFDRLWIHGLSDNIAARTSFVNPTSTIITAVNSPTFIPSVGYQGNGTTSYLSSNFNALTQGVKFTLNNASTFVYIQENIIALKCAIGAFTGGNSGVMIYPQYVLNQGLYYINNTSPDNITSQNSKGFSSCIRTSNLVTEGYKNGISSGLNARISTNMPNTNIFILGQSTNGSLTAAYNGTISVSGFGSANYSQLAFYTAIQNLAISLGWNV